MGHPEVFYDLITLGCLLGQSWVEDPISFSLYTVKFYIEGFVTQDTTTLQDIDTTGYAIGDQVHRKLVYFTPNTLSPGL